MDEDELRELQDPSNWDYENAQIGVPVDDVGAVVAVRFSADEFERVARRAAETGVSLTSFVRDSVLDRVAQQRVR